MGDWRESKSDGFAHWKQAIGVAPEFPRLGPTKLTSREDPWGEGFEEDQRLYLSRAHRHSLGNLRSSIEFTQVRFALGHGCSTIARLLFDHFASQSLVRGYIPVLFSIEDEADRSTPTPEPSSVAGLA